MVELGNIIVNLFLSYYVLYILQMIFSRNSRKSVQQSNSRLDELRKVPLKSLEEQKEFVNTKYPKRNPFQWTFHNILNAIIYIIGWAVAFTFIYSAFSRAVDMLGWKINIWMAILFVTVFPIILNIILKRFHLEKDDLGIFFKGWRSK